MADTTTKTLRLTIAASTSTAEQAFANLNKEIKNTGVSITGFTTAMTKNAAGMDSYAHYVTLASTSLKELEKTQKSIVGSSTKAPITSNILKDERDIYKERADLAAKSSATMVEKAKAAVTAQLIAIKEGENSIAAVKNSSAERQKQIETNLQEKLKSIRDRYAAGEFNKGSLDLSIRSITEAYQRQTVSLVTETDKRIAKIKEEIAAQQEAARVARLSIAQRLGEAQVYTPRSDAGIALTRGMTQAGLAARPTVPQVQAPVIPPIPQETRSSYDSLFARIGAINIEYRIWNATINTVVNSLRAIPKIGIELEATRAVLTSTTGSEAGMAATMQALTREADRTGISLEAVRQSFRNFQASTSLAGVSAESTWKMFSNMNTVISGLHLSTDQANHVFLALAQIFNKSKVQSEELVKQLGNLLPGAFASFAKSMGISTQKLAEDMKKGLVYANDTMENFTTFMATRFKDAFEAASNGLNANLNRMNTGFIQLGEAIYGVSGGPLNAATIKIREFTDYLTASIKGENNFMQVTAEVANVIGTVLVASLIKAGVAIFDLEKAFLAVKAAALSAEGAVIALKDSALLLGSNAVLTALTYFVIKFREAGIEQENIHAQMGKTISLMQQQKVLTDSTKPPEVRAEMDPNIVEMDKTLSTYKKRLNELLSDEAQGMSVAVTDKGKVAIGQAIKQADEAITELTTRRKEIVGIKAAAIKKADEDAFREATTGGKNFEQLQERLAEDELKRNKKYAELYVAQFKRVNEDGYNDAKKTLEENKAKLAKLGTLTTDPEATAQKIKEIKESNEKLNKTIALYDQDLLLEKKRGEEQSAKESETAAKKASAVKLAGIKEEINQVKEYQRTAANEAENQIKLLDSENKAKIYSFEEYARRKKEILAKDYEAEKGFNEQQRALAAGTGRKDLAAKYEERLKQLKDTYESKVGTAETKGVIDNEAQQNIDEYNTNLTMIHQRYQDILGIERDSNDLSSTKLELLRKQLELESKEKGEVGERARIGAKELEILVQAQNLKANIAINQRNLTAAEKVANDALQRNQELKQVGQMTDLQYALSNTKIKREQIRLSELEVDAMKRKLDAAKPEERPAAQATYDIAKQKLESLKLVADETGAMIEQSLGNAFEGAFNGLITKSMTARQAFASFTNSILADIAKIIAQEMRSQLIRAIIAPLAKAAWSGLGNLGQSAGLFQATNISSNPNMVGPMKPDLPFRAISVNANGGIYTGAGISAHSGTIVSSPTVFPFAKGVGLMGEAGPEAILPLKRNAQGKLGVVTENAGQSKGNLYNITVNVQSKQGENPEQFGQRAAAAMMRSIAKEEISNAKRPGNTLNKARFG